MTRVYWSNTERNWLIEDWSGEQADKLLATFLDTVLVKKLEQPYFLENYGFKGGKLLQQNNNYFFNFDES